MKNYICYINGVSSSGKTAISKAMLSLIKEKTIYLSLDNTHESLCDYFNTDEWILYKEEVYGIHRSAKVWYDLGFNVIIDCVLAEEILWEDRMKVIPESFFVGIFVPLDILLQREKQRGRRNFDLVKHQFSITHQDKSQYHIKIDSSKNTPQELAKYIIEKLSLLS